MTVLKNDDKIPVMFKTNRCKSLYIILICLLLVACGGSDEGSGENNPSGSSGGGKRTTITDPIVTSVGESEVCDGGSSVIDASNSSEGYIMINYTGTSSKVQVQITNPDGNVYPYPFATGDYRAFPLTGGDGSYNIDVLENVSGDMYSLCQSQSINVSLNDEFRPFLYPNQYVGYTGASSVVKKGIELSNESSDDINYVENVYEYTISNISYDEVFAANAPVNYIPNPDDTLSSNKGICFDYASVMSSMLRSQGIPTKLVVGYSGEAYHAWISVYLDETGWVDNIIEFDGSSWSLMDPTWAANNDSTSVGQYIGDGSNYTAKYYY